MTCPLPGAAAAVLRPEPGNARTVARLAALGVAASALPLFAYRALEWTWPAGPFDALLLTSAAAARLGGEAPGASGLPVVAVGAATAAAARARGLDVVLTGSSDAAAAVDAARRAGLGRMLHLAGRDHVASVADSVAVYAADAVPVDAARLRTLAGATVLLHSARAARRLGTLLEGAGVPRRAVGIAALAPAVAQAAGEGWRAVGIAQAPTDAALCALVAAGGSPAPSRSRPAD